MNKTEECGHRLDHVEAWYFETDGCPMCQHAERGRRIEELELQNRRLKEAVEGLLDIHDGECSAGLTCKQVQDYRDSLNAIKTTEA